MSIAPPATLERARQAKAVLLQRLAGLSELRGIGIALLKGGYGVKVNLSRALEEGVVPDDVDGVPVIVDIVGQIVPL